MTSLRETAEHKRRSLEVAEEAREAEWQHPSFVGELFLGRVRWELIAPYPAQPAADRAVGDAFLARLETFLKSRVDPDAIDRTGEMPPEVIRGLAELGCFGMKVPQDYGGLGLSQTNYNRAIALIGSYCGSTAVWLSAHQSIGVPQPLKLFGTEEQKRAYLSRFAKGEISAFALTEPDVGSDPAKMGTTATPTPDGQYYVLNGEKLWCTNGPVADVLIVMAKTPPTIIKGREKTQITAFIVEKTMPGFEVAHRCQFMGIRGIQNGLLRFRNMRVPKANILWGEGQGLKLALITLNTGRLTLPAGCTGMAKRCLEITRRWANERSQWGAPIGQHEAITAKIAAMAANTFAMDAVTWLASALVDRGGADVRLEAAMAKLFCTELSWQIADDTLQIRGGRGYETADSLKARGEAPVPVERILRDARINRIIEGTTEIMHLFIAREALDPHLRRILPLVSGQGAALSRLRQALAACWHYAGWYPRLWLPAGVGWRYRALPRPLAAHMRYVTWASHGLARALFHAMAVYQQRLEKRQQLLFRCVDIGTELFAMAASCSRAQHLAASDPATNTPVELADLFCRQARRRIAAAFSALASNDDRAVYRLGRNVLSGKYQWLEQGIVGNNQ